MPTSTIEEFPSRQPLETVKAELAVQIPLTMETGCACQQGDVLGVITATGFGRRRSKTLADGAGFVTTSPNGAVEDASLFKAGDVLKNAAGATVGTVQSVNVAANTVTLTGNAAVVVADGAEVLGSDGSQTASVIADEGSDGNGKTPIRVFIAGLLRESQLRGLDASAKTELGGKSKPGDIFKF